VAISFIADKTGIEKSTFAATVAFTDSAGSSVTPDSISWTLTNDAGTVINSREDVAIGTPAASVDITLSGDDLQMLAGEGRTAFRYLTVDAGYDGDLADNLPFKNACEFELFRRDIATARPVDLVEVKRQLSIHPTSTDHDAHLEGLILAAHTHVETYTARKLVQQTVTIYRDSWAGDFPLYEPGAIVLPYGQLASVTSIKYTDTDETQTTWSAANYDVEATQGYDPDRDTGRVRLAYGKAWPTASLYPSRPIEVVFVCGYGSSSASIPAPIRHAMLLMIDDMFQHRGDHVPLTGQIANLRAAESLLSAYRMWGFV